MAKIETTANRIKAAMNQRGIKAAELSRITGISKSTLSCYLTERRHPADENIEKISRVLMVSEAWLLGYGDDNKLTATKEMLMEMIQNMDDTQALKTCNFIKEYIL